MGNIFSKTNLMLVGLGLVAIFIANRTALGRQIVKGA